MSGSFRNPSPDGLVTFSFKHFYLGRIYRVAPPFCLVIALAAQYLWLGYLKGIVTWSRVAAEQQTNSGQPFGSFAL